MTCATCKHWTLLNRLNKDARAMARLHLVNCAHDKPWVFYPAHESCPRFAPASAETVAARANWLPASEPSGSSSPPADGGA